MSVSCDRVKATKCAKEGCKAIVSDDSAKAATARYGEVLCGYCELGLLRSIFDTGRLVCEKL